MFNNNFHSQTPLELSSSNCTVLCSDPIYEALIKYQRQMQLRGFSPNTQKAYMYHVQLFLATYPQAVSKPELTMIQQFLHEVIRQGLSQNYTNTRYSALRFYVESALGLEWNAKQLPRLKKVHSILQF